MNILEYISNIPSDRVAFISENERFLYIDIVKLFAKNKDIINTLKESSIVINSRSKLEFCKLLSILDGNVKRILFLPEDIDKNLFEKYYKESNVNFEVYLDNNSLKINIIDENINESVKNIKNTQWIIPTSGTTNIPKLVAHTFQSLSKTTKRNIDLGQKYIWGLTFDIYRFSGIQVFLQVIYSGSSMIIPNSFHSMDEIIKLFVKNSCNIISATPSFYRKILMTKESDKLNIKSATLGGEISDQSILSALKNKFKNKFKNIKIIHIYASTEVGVGFSVNDGLEGFPYSYIEEGFGSIKMRIDANSILWINPGKIEQEYVSRDIMYENDGFINTGDLVKVENNRVFFLGRESGSINVGGNKVLPEEVELKLLASELISSVIVYSKKSSIIGSLVCADVVVKDKEQDKKQLKNEIMNYCRNNLENFKIPAILRIVDNLEITHSGKIKRT
jgi:acyl-CoA synthetase (AMP-forming)/AMP-acid ligase II